MSEVIFFLGAGASASFGIPTNQTFVNEFKEELKGEDQNVVDFYNDILNFLNKNYPQNNDLESVFSIIESFSEGATLKKLGSLAMFYIGRYYGEKLKGSDNRIKLSVTQNKRKKSDNEICQQLKQKLKNYVLTRCNSPDEEKVLQIYDNFFNEISPNLSFAATPSGNKCPLSDIFTTNYDTCVELYSSKRGIHCNSGIDFDPISRLNVLKSKNYGRQATIYLYKLHGSIDLYRLGNGDIAHFPVPPSSNRIAGGERILSEWMIYPIQEKYIYQEPFFSIFNLMKEGLSKAGTWIIIGHSFRDVAIKNIFLDVEKRKGRRIILIDKNADDILEKNIPEMKNDITPINKSFGSSDVASAVNDALSPKK